MITHMDDISFSLCILYFFICHHFYNKHSTIGVVICYHSIHITDTMANQETHQVLNLFYSQATLGVVSTWMGDYLG